MSISFIRVDDRMIDLYARVKTVHRAVARKKLTEGNILQHS